jgi:hypothetical protein
MKVLGTILFLICYSISNAQIINQELNWHTINAMNIAKGNATFCKNKKVRSNERLIAYTNFKRSNSLNTDSSLLVYKSNYGFDLTPLVFIEYLVVDTNFNLYDPKKNYFDSLINYKTDILNNTTYVG